MSDTANSQPDRAIDGFDDDVPTYEPPKETSQFAESRPEPDSIYKRSGRVAPQVIKPKTESEPEPTVSMPSAGDAEAKTSEPVSELTEEYTDSDYAPHRASDAIEETEYLSRPEPSYQPIEQVDPVVPEESTVALADPALQDHSGAEDTSDPDYRRGTTDLGLLLLRLLVAGWLLVDSLKAFFGFGGGGIGNLQEHFAAYAQPHLLAIVVPGLELAAGVFLLLGLVTPLFAALATVATGFSVVHTYTQHSVGFNPFNWDAPLMLAVILAVLTIALQFTGPGLYSFDAGRSWARRPLASSWLFVILAVIGAAGLWWFGAATNPFN